MSGKPFRARSGLRRGDSLVWLGARARRTAAWDRRPRTAAQKHRTMTEPTTPLMRQYHAIKTRYPHALLLFRLGDFYELFYEDALVASRELQITLTARNRE